MRYVETAVAGACVVEIEPFSDDRGFFARTWCEREAAERGVALGTAQCSVSLNRRRGTLRGMHYQVEPHHEAKLVRCTRGAIWDVAADIRPGSPTFGRWAGVTLTAESRSMLYVPPGCAHGFLTLTDDAEVFYQISNFYAPGHQRGFRWNDPFFAIDWPAAVEVIAERDRCYPDFGKS